MQPQNDVHMEEPPAHDEPDAGDWADWQESGLSWEAWLDRRRMLYDRWREERSSLFDLAVDLIKRTKGDFDD